MTPVRENPVAVAVVCLVVGVGVAALPAVLFPFHGQAAYSVTVTPFEGDAGDRNVVEFDDLPPRAQEAVEGAMNDRAVILYSGAHDASVDALFQPTLVRYDGELYRADVHNVPEHGRTGDRARGPLALSGALLIAAGLLVGYGREFRPATPARAAAIPPILLAVTAVSLGTGPGELLRGFESDPVGTALGLLVVLAILVPMAAEASRSRARNASRSLLVAGFIGAFLVGAIPAVLGGLGVEFAPVGGLAALLGYAMAPDDG